MKEEPLVSIITVSYNRGYAIESTIKSILSQDYKNIEYVFIDDGSKDNTSDLVRSFLYDKRLKFIQKRNTGFTHSLIFGMSVAQGDYIAIQGAGDTSVAHRISKQVDILVSNLKIGIVGSYYEKVNFNSGKIIQTIAPKIDNNSKAFGFSHGELMYRTKDYDTAGGYRGLFDVGQGTDLWNRMKSICQIEVIPEVLYKQNIFEKSVSTDQRKLLIRDIYFKIQNQLENQRNNSLPDNLSSYGNSWVFLSPTNFSLELTFLKAYFKSGIQDKDIATKLYLRAFSSLLCIPLIPIYFIIRIIPNKILFFKKWL